MLKPRVRIKPPIVNFLMDIEDRLKNTDADTSERIIDAVKSNNLCSLNGLSPITGDNAVHWSIRNGHDGALEALLRLGAWSNKCDKDGKHPIEMVIECGSAAMLRSLVRHGASVDHKIVGSGNTPLMHAVLLKKYDMATELMRLGADVFCQDKDGLTALMLCAHDANNGHELAAEMISSAAKGMTDEDKEIRKKEFIETKDSRGQTALVKSILAKNSRVLKLLVENGSDVNTRDKKLRRPLFWASVKDNALFAKYLIDNGADLNSAHVDGSTPLGHAAKNGFGKVVSVLLNAGAEVDVADRYATPLVHACKHGRAAEAKLLLKSGADPDETNQVDDSHTPLIYAIKRHDHELVRDLIDHGADVNKANAHGWTPLMYATALCDKDPKNLFKIISLLLYADANPGITNDIDQSSISLLDKISDADDRERLSRAYHRLANTLSIESVFGKDAERIIKEAQYENVSSGYSFSNEIETRKIDIDYLVEKFEYDAQKRHAEIMDNVRSGKRVFADMILELAEKGLAPAGAMYALSEQNFIAATVIGGIAVAKFVYGEKRESIDKMIDFIDYTCIRISVALDEAGDSVSGAVARFWGKVTDELVKIRDTVAALLSAPAKFARKIIDGANLFADKNINDAIVAMDVDKIVDGKLEDIADYLSEDYNILFSKKPPSLGAAELSNDSAERASRHDGHKIEDLSVGR